MANVNTVKGEKYIFTLKNTTIAMLTVALLAAFFDTRAEGSNLMNNPAEINKAGYTCDVVADDGVINGAAAATLTLTPANAKMTYRAFREYIKLNSRALKGMSIQTNNLQAFNQTMEIIDASPLIGTKSVYIPLSELRDGFSNLNDLVKLEGDGIVFGFDTLVFLPILPGHEITITFWF
jgi:hypothetical protein